MVLKTMSQVINHPQVYIYTLPFNFGKALAVNFFIKNYLRPDFLPKNHCISGSRHLFFAKTLSIRSIREPTAMWYDRHALYKRLQSRTKFIFQPQNHPRH